MFESPLAGMAPRPPRSRKVQLFREAALARELDQFGDVVHWRGVRHRSLTWMVLGALGLAAVVLMRLEYAEKLTVGGAAMPLTQPVILKAQAQGIVAQLWVDEAAAVEAGARLIEVASERYQPNGQTRVQQQLAELTRSRAALDQELKQMSDLHTVRRRGLRERLRRVRLLQASLEQGGTLIERRAALAEQAMSRADRLRDAGAMSQQDYEAVQAGALEHASGLQTHRQRALDASTQAMTLEDDIELANAQFELSRVQLTAQRDSIAHEMSRVGHSDRELIVAPVSGYVTALQVRSGDAVSVGSTLLTLVADEGAHEVQLRLPPTAASRVRPGMSVRMRYAGYPFQEFGMVDGEVVRVHSVPSGPGGSGYTAQVKIVDLPDAVDVVPSGMSITADVVLERRRLWRWLVEPLLTTFSRV